MARLPRSITVRPGYQAHVTWRGHNREANIEEAADKTAYLQALLEEKLKDSEPNFLLALVLMSNHVHELYAIADQVSFSAFMRRHHSRYGQHFNRRHRRSGQVAEGRPKSSLVENGVYEMNAVFYIHANPLRAKLVKDAAAYRWSTHSLYAFGHRAPWMRDVRFPKWYLALGHTKEQRQSRYRKLFARYLGEEEEVISSLLASSIFWGNPTWVSQQGNCLRAWLRERTYAISRTAREGPSLKNSRSEYYATD